MDAHLLEELRSAANSEILLSKEAASQRLFPALNISRCQTNRTDKLQSAATEERLSIIRTKLNSTGPNDLLRALKALSNTNSTDEFLDKLAKSGE
jgi:transcription termination factor Rho